MPELTSITVKGFKSIASIEDLRLGAMNLLIGPNGSGKSNFIEVFTFLRAIRKRRLQEYVAKAGGANKVLHFGARVTETLELSVSFRPDGNSYKIEIQVTDVDELVPRREVAYFSGTESDVPPFPDELRRIGKEAGISQPTPNDAKNYFQFHLDNWRVFHFHDTSSSSPVKRTANLNDNRRLRPDGSNLPAFLYMLRKNHEDSYNLIVRTVRQVAPFFEDFVLDPQELSSDTIRMEWSHVGTDVYFDVSSISDGTLRFIALATLFLQPERFRPSVILVDEPELGLHPSAITLLASLMRSASVETQVIVSTQSSLLLDHFDPEDVLVADRIGGGTLLTRLDPSKLKSWLEDYSLGELWEKNGLGGRPRSE